MLVSIFWETVRVKGYVIVEEEERKVSFFLVELRLEKKVREMRFYTFSGSQAYVN